MILGGWGEVQVTEDLHNIEEALGLIPSTAYIGHGGVCLKSLEVEAGG